MPTSKSWTLTAMGSLFLLTLLQAQELNITKPPKWNFGVRGGAGFSHLQLDGRQARVQYFNTENGTITTYRPGARSELFIGGYATRNFGQKWSVRSEMSLVSERILGMSLGLGVFPRYKLTDWLTFETGVEQRLPLSRGGQNETRFSLGAVFGGQNLEFNLRYLPAYQPASIYGKGQWLGGAQVGMSFNLASFCKHSKGKKS